MKATRPILTGTAKDEVIDVDEDVDVTFEEDDVAATEDATKLVVTQKATIASHTEIVLTIVAIFELRFNT